MLNLSYFVLPQLTIGSMTPLNNGVSTGLGLSELIDKIFPLSSKIRSTGMPQDARIIVPLLLQLRRHTVPHLWPERTVEQSELFCWGMFDGSGAFKIFISRDVSTYILSRNNFFLFYIYTPLEIILHVKTLKATLYKRMVSWKNLC